MKKQISKYTLAVALLLSSSSAQVIDGPRGLAGPAPCIESYTGVWSSANTVDDFHAVHGLQTKKDKALVTVGNGKNFTPNGKDGVVVKVNECKTNRKYDGYSYDKDDGDCLKPVWSTKLTSQDKDKKNGGYWLAESPDGSFIIAVGF